MLFRSLFALALLVGIGTPAAGAVPPDARTASADGSRTAEPLARVYACFTHAGERVCGYAAEGMTCDDVQTNMDRHNQTARGRNRMRRLSCMSVAGGPGDVPDGIGTTVATDDGFALDLGDTEPPGTHLGVFVTYVQGGTVRVVEAGEGSNLKALLDMAAMTPGCEPVPRVPLSVEVMATAGPGAVRLNGRTVEVPRARVTTPRNARYGDIIIDGAKLDLD